MKVNIDDIKKFLDDPVENITRLGLTHEEQVRILNMIIQNNKYINYRNSKGAFYVVAGIFSIDFISHILSYEITIAFVILFIIKMIILNCVIVDWVYAFKGNKKRYKAYEKANTL